MNMSSDFVQQIFLCRLNQVRTKELMKTATDVRGWFSLEGR